MVWPVLFIYPQSMQTDAVEAFHELHAFRDHLDVMFAPEVRRSAPWRTQLDVKPRFNITLWPSSACICASSNTMVSHKTSVLQSLCTSDAMMILPASRGSALRSIS